MFFSNAVKNLKITEFSDTNPLAERLSNPTLNAILKYKNHPSIIPIRNVQIIILIFISMKLVLKKFIKRLEN